MNENAHSCSGTARLDAAGKAIQRKAATWLALRQARGFTLQENADFAAWCAADPRHAEIFYELESAWRVFDKLGSYPQQSDVPADPDLLAPDRTPRRFVVPALWAAAAAAAVTAVGWWQPWRSSSLEKTTAAVVDVVPRFLHLSDGSDVELKSGSEVLERFTSAERRVQLVRGEAKFTVAKNPARPFFVVAGGITVRAVGTAFNVRLGTVATEVLVTEGTVQVSLAGLFKNAARATPLEPLVLVAGQRTVVPTVAAVESERPAIETLASSEIDRELAWEGGSLEFDETPLSEVVARFNRHSAQEKSGPRLVVADPELSGMRFSGRVRAGNVESFVEVLESNFGVAADRRHQPEEIVLRKVR